jgi:hypothetical protein
MADPFFPQTPAGPPARRPEAIEREQKEIGGPTQYVNRFLVQSYPDSGSIRIVLAEAFTSSPDQIAGFRGAYYIERGTAVHLLNLLSQALGLAVVPLVPPSPPPPNPVKENG